MSSIVPAHNVHETLQQKILLSGMDVVFDLDRSEGNHLFDSRSGRTFLDMFTFYASRALSFDHPNLSDPAFRAELGRVAAHKPSNCDVYTREYATFVRTMGATCARDFPHLFVVSGGALAVENALKCAFDWKVRKNLAAGRGDRGSQIVHFRQAFHGRSGYTLSLTDSPDPNKTLHFPRFSWPRLPNPGVRFPLDAANLAAAEAAEQESLAALTTVLREQGDDIAAILIEPIQAEGGDHHFRPEFLQALRTAADEHEALLIFDEVQTGMGLTGAWWAHERLNVKPDIVVFGKKFQVCGILASERIDDVDNVFVVPSRISSTFEGNLVDMVRSTEILRTIAEEELVSHARSEGQWLLEQLQALDVRSDAVSNARGLGLMAAFDLPTKQARDAFLKRCYEAGMIILGCGHQSVRFRPSLDVKREDLQAALDIVEACLPR